MPTFRISNTFAAKCADVLKVDAPWPDAQLVLHLYRPDAPAFLARRRDSLDDSPVLREMTLQELTDEVERQKAARQKRVIDGVAVPEVVAAEPPKEVNLFGMMLDKVRARELQLSDLLNFQDNQRTEEAIDMVAGWEGWGVHDQDTGELIPANRANVSALLRDTSLVSEGYGAGKAMGAALVDFILETTSTHAIGRAALLEGAAGNSEPSSATPEGEQGGSTL